MSQTQEDETAGRAREMLLEFLREHDAPCPVCGYNLRALTRPVCPECKQELVLTVGASRLRIGWLLAAVAPGFFSGIAAMFVLVPIVGMWLNGGLYSPTLIAVDLFGWCSGAVALLIAMNRITFLSQPRWRQQWIAMTIWLVHAAAFAAALLIGPRYL